MKTIGVLGGIGPQATMDFEARVHAAAQRLIPPAANTGYPPMVVYYHRSAPVLLGADHRPVLPIQVDPRFLDAVRRLGAWADFLVVTANGPHRFRDFIEQAAGCELLSMVDLVLAEAQRRQPQRVGVLGLGEPLVYTEPLGRLGIPFEIVSPELRDRLDQAIFKVDEGRVGPAEQAAARDAIAALRAQGAGCIILGCTEIPFLLGDEQNEPEYIHPIALLAEAAVRRAME